MEGNRQLNVTVCQTDIIWADAKANRESARKIIESCIKNSDKNESPAQGDRLFVLPEMWNTGFGMKTSEIAEKEKESETLRWMHLMADTFRTALCGSIPVIARDGTCRNRLYFVKPDEPEAEFYDKHHLFTYGCENDSYVAGNKHVIVEWGGLRILLMVCYDLRFPVWSRYWYAGEYDAIIYVANWPDKRQIGWDILTKARAIENQSYVIAVNRIGSDPITTYGGGSRIIDATGKVLAECEPGKQSTASAILTKSKLLERRNHFKVLPDMDRIPLKTSRETKKVT